MIKKIISISLLLSMMICNIAYAKTSTPNTALSLTASVFDSTEAINHEYKITYKANGGTGNDTVEWKSSGVNYTILGNQFAAPLGKEFDGWKTGASSGTSYAAGNTYRKNETLTLYAQWKEVLEPSSSVTLSFPDYGYMDEVICYWNGGSTTYDLFHFNNIKVHPGYKVEMRSNYVNQWYYRAIDYEYGDDDHYIGSSRSCYFIVPSNASGTATMSCDDEDGTFKYNNSTGWIKSEACYPVLGE